jgi:hypothetical protein
VHEKKKRLKIKPFSQEWIKMNATLILVEIYRKIINKTVLDFKHQPNLLKAALISSPKLGSLSISSNWNMWIFIQDRLGLQMISTIQ